MSGAVDYFIVNIASDRIVKMIPTEAQGADLMRILRDSTDDPKAHRATSHPDAKQMRDWVIGLHARIADLQEENYHLGDRISALEPEVDRFREQAAQAQRRILDVGNAGVTLANSAGDEISALAQRAEKAEAILARIGELADRFERIWRLPACAGAVRNVLAGKPVILGRPSRQGG